MQSLGTNASLDTFRRDLVFLHAGLLGEDAPEVAALAAPIGTLIEEIRAERDLYERAENAAVVMTARQGSRDRKLDRHVITFGGVVRAVSSRVYNIFFSTLSPSGVARASLERETAEVDRILGELARLPADDAFRTGYEGPMRALLASLREAARNAAAANVALSLARSRLAQFKLRADRARVETHGRLQTLLGDRKAADEFFRPTTRAPAEEEAEAPPAPAPAPAPPA